MTVVIVMVLMGMEVTAVTAVTAKTTMIPKTTVVVQKTVLIQHRHCRTMTIPVYRRLSQMKHLVFLLLLELFCCWHLFFLWFFIASVVFQSNTIAACIVTCVAHQPVAVVVTAITVTVAPIVLPTCD